MKRSVVALSLLALALTGCTSDTNQSGGDSNPDSQVEQPPLPGEEDAGGSSQGPDEDSGPDDTDDGDDSQ